MGAWTRGGLGLWNPAVPPASFPGLGILAWEGSALLAETLTVRGASELGPCPWPLLLAALIWGFPLVLVVRTPFAIKTWRLFQLGFLGHFLGLLRVPGCDRAPGAGAVPEGLSRGPSPPGPSPFPWEFLQWDQGSARASCPAPAQPTSCTKKPGIPVFFLLLPLQSLSSGAAQHRLGPV